jgi:cysteine desulfurase
MHRAYLDNASTTPLDARVYKAMQPYLETHYGNASSIHAFGQLTKNALEDARESVAKLLHAAPAEIFFTSSGTEADNLALKGVVFAESEKKNHIISSALEHKAVLESVEWLQKKMKVDVDFIAHDAHGRLDLDDLRKKIRPNKTALISVMHANNELGNINRIADAARVARSFGIPFHTDAVQSAGKVPLDMPSLGVDLAAITAHKFYGPKGVGVLYVRQGTPLEPLFHGGSHERNRRAGTENVASAVALAEALKLAVAEQEASQHHAAELRKFFLSELQQASVPFTINGDAENMLPNILNLSFPIPPSRKLAGDVLLLGLDAAGIAVSSGSACTSGTAKPSHVLLALGKTEHDARASVRVSFSKFNTTEDVKTAAHGFADVLRRLVN